MELQTLTYLVVGASFVLYIAIAFLTQARNTGEFYVAGGHVHPVINGMATAAARPPRSLAELLHRQRGSLRRGRRVVVPPTAAIAAWVHGAPDVLASGGIAERARRMR